MVLHTSFHLAGPCMYLLLYPTFEFTVPVWQMMLLVNLDKKTCLLLLVLPPPSTVRTRASDRIWRLVCWSVLCCTTFVIVLLHRQTTVSVYGIPSDIITFDLFGEAEFPSMLLKAILFLQKPFSRRLGFFDEWTTWTLIFMLALTICTPFFIALWPFLVDLVEGGRFI